MSKKKAGVKGIPAADWLQHFKAADVEQEALKEAKSQQAKATKAGNFLSRLVDREVPIEVDGRTGKATLRMEKGRANKKHYWFDVCWDEPEGPAGDKRPPAAGRRKPGTDHRQQAVGSQQRASGRNDLHHKPARKVTSPPGGNREVW